MQKRLFPLFAALLALALVASACGSSDDADTETADDETTTVDSASDDEAPAADDAEENTADSEMSDDGMSDDGMSDSEMADNESSTDTEPVTVDTPEDVVQGVTRNLYNVDPTDEQIACMVDKSTTDDAWEATVAGLADGSRNLEAAEAADMAAIANGCLDSQSLGEWATQGVGLTGPEADAAPACFAAAFDDPDTGDQTFQGFTSVTVGFPPAADDADLLTSTLTDCAPVSSIASIFIDQFEAQTGYTTVVDSDCFADAVGAADVSRGFWSRVVDRTEPPAAYLEPFLTECSEAADSDLAAAPPAGWEPWSGDGALAGVTPGARANLYSTPPPMSIDADGSYEAVLATGGGEIRIRLLADTAPITVNNFVSLARDGYYDGTVFHRVLDGFMAQGGDPTGTGSGGPGYQFEDEFEGGPRLDKPGLLAMANAGPGTNGSQFFITFVETDYLTGSHTVFGEVVEGMDIVDAIERRDPAAPSGRGQVLESVTIIEG